jgi:hypothetical protein
MQIVDMKESKVNRIKELEQKAKELELIVGVRQIKIDFLEKMTEISKDEFGIDLKKNFSIQRSTGLEKIDTK